MDSNLALGDDFVLPAEILRLIMLNYDQLEEEKALEELKKCRLISQKFYETVDNLFQNKFYQKFQIHFDGLVQSHSYTEAAQFGENLFGESKLNLPTLKISHCEIYLLKTWLGNLILTNIKTLGLLDNLLNWKELIQILKMFKNVENLNFFQTSRRSEQLYLLFHKDFNPDLNDSEMIEMIKNEVGNEDFLPNLKLLKIWAIHPKIMNIFSMIIAQAVQCQLKDLMIIVHDIPALFKSLQLHPQRNRSQELNIKILKHLVGFSKSLKTLYISVPFDFDKESEEFMNSRKVFCIHFMKMFSKLENYFAHYKRFEKIEINIKEGFGFIFEEYSFLNFIKNQDNLKMLKIYWLTDQFIEKWNPVDVDQMKYKRDLSKILQGLVKSNCTTTFEYYSAFNYGLEPILNISTNLLKIDIEMKETLWRFSDYRIPIFSNCKILFIAISQANQFSSFNQQWPDFDVEGIVRKFPNLNALFIADISLVNEHNPSISNEDLQIIIRNYANLYNLSLLYCCRNLGDVGITGLTHEALELRKNDPNLPIRPEEMSGLPISNLKKLEKLLICKNHQDQIQITDLSPKFGFEKMDNLKSIELINTKITSEGIEILREKIKPRFLEIKND